MSKKNLDQLFQEKFKDFTEVPSEHIWEKIETSLNQKKKNRMVIPFWWKLGGVAALLALILYVVNPFEGNYNEIPIVTDIEKADSDIQEKIENGNTFQNAASPENSSTESDSNATDESVKDISPNNTGVVKTDATRVKGNPSGSTGSPLNPQSIQVVENESKSELYQGKKTKENNGNTFAKETEAMAINEVDQNELEKTGKNPDQINKEKHVLQDVFPETKEGVVAQNEVKNEAVKNPDKKSIFDEIEEQSEENLAENSGGKWSVGANVAPVYFNSFGEGSPIHSSFVPNSKSGEINLSYGLSVAYSVGKKLNVRTGISKVEYGYVTNDVEFSSTFNASASDQIANINYTQTSENLFVSSKTSANALKNGDAFDFASFDNSSRDAVMSQQFGYIEVPVELDYALIDKRFGLNVVGGLSTLFLMDNSVSIASGDLASEIGTANNLNSVNFSTNIGLGVNYKFTPKLLLNVEPVFKYQLNTFSNTSGNFQPYSIGVYSGLKFKF